MLFKNVCTLHFGNLSRTRATPVFAIPRELGEIRGEAKAKGRGEENESAN